LCWATSASARHKYDCLVVVVVVMVVVVVVMVMVFVVMMVMMMMVIPPPVVIMVMMVMMVVIMVMMVMMVVMMVMMMVVNELHVGVTAILAIRRGSHCVCDSQNSGSVWNGIEQLAVRSRRRNRGLDIRHLDGLSSTER
jgi:membrane-associated HD superfamily phosphohydrolase